MAPHVDIFHLVRLSLERATRTKSIRSLDSTDATGLQKCLNLKDVVGFGLGATIGGGIFVATGEAALVAGPGVVLSFMLAAIGCGCSGLCYAEMAVISPSAGGSYSYAYILVGELAAFLVGMFNTLGNILASAAVARGWASYLLLLLAEIGIQAPSALASWELGPVTASPLAFMLVAVLGIVMLGGTRDTATLNSAVTVLSVFLLGCFIVGGAPSVAVARWQPFLPEGVAGVVRGAGVVFFAFLGFDVLACLSEETENSFVVPRAIVLTLVISTTLYVSTALVFTGLVVRDEISSGAPLAAAARARGLVGVAMAISVAAVGNTLTTAMSGLLGAPRVCCVMARDGLLPAHLARLDGRGVPVRALLLTAVPCALCAGLAEFEALADIVSAGSLCTFALVCAAVVISRSAGSEEHHKLNAYEARAVGSAPAPNIIGNMDVVCEIDGIVDDLPKPSSDLPTAPDISSAPFMKLRLLVYASCCLLTGLLVKHSSGAEGATPNSEAGGRMAGIAGALAFVLAAVAGVSIARQFQQGGARSEHAGKDDSKPGTFRLPCVPLVPLTGRGGPRSESI